MKSIIINKYERLLTVYEEGEAIWQTVIALGSNPMGAKTSAGDDKTPEGDYTICVKNPTSKYGLSLGISYPNAEDIRRGYDQGVIDEATYRALTEADGPASWETPLGGEIYIHGGGTMGDWTAGCIAMETADMQKLFDLIEVDCSVSILPGIEIPISFMI